MTYQAATAFGQRPSDLEGIPAAHAQLRADFDKAVLLFGRWADSRMRETNDKGRPKRSPESVLRDPRWLVGLRPIDVKALATRMTQSDERDRRLGVARGRG